MADLVFADYFQAVDDAPTAAQVQTAVDAAIANGKVVRLPPGEITLGAGEQILVNAANGLIIEGSNPGGTYSGGAPTIIKAAAGFNSGALVKFLSSNNVTLRNLVIDLGSADLANRIGVLQQSTTPPAPDAGSLGLVLENVTIRSSGGGTGIKCGVETDEITNGANKYLNVRFVNLQYGLFLRNTQAVNHTFFHFEAYGVDTIFRVYRGGNINCFFGEGGGNDRLLLIEEPASSGINAGLYNFIGLRMEVGGKTFNTFQWVKSLGEYGCMINFDGIMEAAGSTVNPAVSPTEYAFDAGGHTVINITRSMLRGNQSGDGWPLMFKTSGNASIVVDGQTLTQFNPRDPAAASIAPGTRVVLRDVRDVAAKEWPKLFAD